MTAMLEALSPQFVGNYHVLSVESPCTCRPVDLQTGSSAIPTEAPACDYSKIRECSLNSNEYSAFRSWGPFLFVNYRCKEALMKH